VIASVGCGEATIHSMSRLRLMAGDFSAESNTPIPPGE
jgi:hypothetical protein